MYQPIHNIHNFYVQYIVYKYILYNNCLIQYIQQSMMRYMQLYLTFSGKVSGRPSKTSEAWEMQSIPSLQPGYGCEVRGGGFRGIPDFEKRLQGKRGKEPSPKEKNKLTKNGEHNKKWRSESEERNTCMVHGIVLYGKESENRIE